MLIVESQYVPLIHTVTDTHNILVLHICKQILLSMYYVVVNVCKCQKILLSSDYWINPMSYIGNWRSLHGISHVTSMLYFYMQDMGITLERMDWTRAQNSSTVKLE